MISIIIVFKDEEQNIERCVKSILCQKYVNFELILIDDNSTDKSTQLVKTFKDHRIRYFRNSRNLGISRSRNLGLEKARGKYIFFTDADCTVGKGWLAKGLKYLEEGYLGVEGKTIYSSQNISVSDTHVHNLNGGQWVTCNIAYRADVLKKVNGFNEIFGNMNEDRDLALRVKKYGPIIFDKEMVVHHSVKKWSSNSLLKRSRDAGRSIVYLYKYHPEDKGLEKMYFILYPTHLSTIIIPPLLIYLLFNRRIKGINDLKILFTFYLGFLIERFYIWKTAFKETILVI